MKVDRKAKISGSRVRLQVKDHNAEVSVDPRDDLEEMLERKQNEQQNIIEDEPEVNPMSNILQKNEEKKSRVTNNHEIRMMWVIDGTSSFTTVFPAVYYKIEAIIKSLEHRKKVKNQNGVFLTYGLTVMNEKTEFCQFSGNLFTESKEKFLEMVRKISLHGGSPDGRENFVGAISTALQALNFGNHENVSRGLFLFSDSLPKEEELRFDFGKMKKDYIDYGVRFAHVFSYDGEKFLPVFETGREGENGKNYTKTYTLQEFIEMDEKEFEEYVEVLAKELFHDCSVGQ